MFLKNPKTKINNRKKTRFISIWAVLLFSAVISGAMFVADLTHAATGINKQINYQGKLLDASGYAVENDTYDIVFKIYDVASGGTALWTGTYTAANGNQDIQVTSGIFSVMLGSGSGNSLNLNFSSDTYYLGVTVGADAEMTPRKRIGSVPQAFNANNLIGDGFINIAGTPTGTGVSEGTMYVNPATAGAGYTLLGVGVGGVEKLRLDASGNMTIAGNVGIGTTSPTALLHLKAGTATASTAPLKFTSGVLNTTAEVGAVEFLTDAYYGTITTGTTRKTFAFLESPTFTGTVTLPTPFTLGAVSVTTTGTELNYVAGVTSAIQTQLNNKQPLDSTLTSIALLGTAGDKIAYTTGIDTWAETGLTAFGRSIIDDADEVTFKTTVNLEIGTDVQAYDADLTTWAGITPGTGVGTALAVNIGTAGSFITNGGALGTPSSGVATNITGLPSASVLAGTFGTGAYIIDTSLTVPLINGSSADNGDITINGTSSATKTTSYVILQATGGNVGIGTTSPGAALEVAGQIKITGGTPGASKVLTSDANGLATWETAAVSGANAALSNLANVAINTALLPGVTDSIDLGSTDFRWANLWLGGETLHLGTSTTDEATVSYTTSTNLLNFSTDSTANGDIAFFSDDLYLDKSTGNVGIGITTPNHKLDVAGNLGLSVSAYLNFGATDGTTGYGIRDNAGTLEYKNSGGEWAGIGSGSGGSGSSIVPNYITGLTTSNNASDANKDLDISTGYAMDFTNAVGMSLTSSLTKQLDATWATGTNAGGLFSGSIASNTLYYVYLIKNTISGTVDAGFSTSSTASDIPSGYTAYRMIDYIRTDASSNIIEYNNVISGDTITKWWKARQTLASGLTATTYTAQSTTGWIPSGLSNVEALFGGISTNSDEPRVMLSTDGINGKTAFQLRNVNNIIGGNGEMYSDFAASPIFIPIVNGQIYHKIDTSTWTFFLRAVRFSRGQPTATIPTSLGGGGSGDLPACTNGQTLSYNATSGVWECDEPSTVGGLIGVQTFTSSGTYTKSAGVTKVRVQVVGGGGGGTSSDGGAMASAGSAGGYSEKFINVTAISSETVTIGTGGAAGSSNSAGSSGGTSSFGSHCSATGGGGGGYNAGSGTPGAGSGGDINASGGYGDNAGGSIGGTGGASYFGGGGKGGYYSSSSTSVAGTAYGSGGGGGVGYSPSTAGAAGAAGIVIVYEYGTTGESSSFWSALDSDIYFNTGNVGIGTTSPLTLTEIQGGLTTTGAILTLSSKETSTVANDVLGRINFRAALDAAGGDAILTGAGILAIAEDTFSATVNKTSLQFQTGASEAATTKMTILSSGNVGIGTTDPGYKLTVAGTAWVTSGAWSGSDVRWKQNIQPVNGALDKVLQLSGVSYTWRKNEFPENEFDDKTHLGFIAQDVEKIVPELVTTGPDGYKGIDYSGFSALLINAIQEQQTKIENISGLGTGNGIAIDGNVGIGTTNPLQTLSIQGQCMTGDTLLAIRRRRRRKNSLGEFEETTDTEDDDWDHLLVPIREILTGDEVLSLNEGTSEVEYHKVNALMDMGIREIFEIRTKSGRVIHTTINHPYLVKA